jgi:hypothetical protein
VDVGLKARRAGEFISGTGQGVVLVGRMFPPGQPPLVQLVAVDVDRLTLHDLADPWRGDPDDLGQHALRDAAARGQRDRPGLQISEFAEVTVNGGDPVGDLEDVGGRGSGDRRSHAAVGGAGLPWGIR